MRSRFHTRVALIAFGVLTILIAGLGISTLRALRQQELNMALITAIKGTDAQRTHDLLALGADPDTFDATRRRNSIWLLLSDQFRSPTEHPHTGTTALILAVNRVPSLYTDKFGNATALAIVSLLLNYGAHVDVKNTDGENIFNVAADSACASQTLELLIQRQSNIDHPILMLRPLPIDWKSAVNGRTPLMTVSGWGGLDSVRILLDAGADVDAKSEFGWTALMYAVSRGRHENIDCLLTHHANVFNRARNGDTVLTLARACRDTNSRNPFRHDDVADPWSDIVATIEQAETRQQRANTIRSN